MCLPLGAERRKIQVWIVSVEVMIGIGWGNEFAKWGGGKEWTSEYIILSSKACEGVRTERRIWGTRVTGSNLPEMNALECLLLHAQAYNCRMNDTTKVNANPLWNVALELFNGHAHVCETHPRARWTESQQRTASRNIHNSKCIFILLMNIHTELIEYLYNIHKEFI